MQIPISSTDFVENEVRTKNLILGWCEGFENLRRLLGLSYKESFKKSYISFFKSINEAQSFIGSKVIPGHRT